MKTAVYDLATAPITFDAMCFAASVGALCRRAKFVVLADQRRSTTRKDLEIDDDEWRWRVHRVIAASMWLMPGCRGVDVTFDRREAAHWRAAEALRPDPLLRTCVGLHAEGRDVCRLRAPAEAVRRLESAGLGERLVVLQIRQSLDQKDKNSDLKSWMTAAEHIARRGYRPIIVPDTDEVVAGYAQYPIETYHPASLDLSLRCALYSSADLVMAAGLGPAGFCAFSGGRYSVLIRHASRSLEELRRPFERIWGIPWGAQLPWAGERQRVVYRGDDAQSICDAFDDAVGLQR